MLHHAVTELELSDGTRTELEALEAELTALGSARRDKQAVQQLLADGVRAGRVDEAAIATAVAGLQERLDARRAKTVAVITKLHAALTPEQRRAVVKATEGKMASRGWLENVDATAASEGDDERRDHEVMRLVRSIKLTDEQRQKLTAELAPLERQRPTAEDVAARRRRHEGAVKVFMQSFGSDAFDPQILESEPFAPKLHDKFTLKAKTFNAVLPVLTEEQRARLATMLERDHKRGRYGKGAPGEGGPGRRAPTKRD